MLYDDTKVSLIHRIFASLHLCFLLILFSRSHFLARFSLAFQNLLVSLHFEDVILVFSFAAASFVFVDCKIKSQNMFLPSVFVELLSYLINTNKNLHFLCRKTVGQYKTNLICFANTNQSGHVKLSHLIELIAIDLDRLFERVADQG